MHFSKFKEILNHERRQNAVQTDEHAVELPAEREEEESAAVGGQPGAVQNHLPVLPPIHVLPGQVSHRRVRNV